MKNERLTFPSSHSSRLISRAARSRSSNSGRHSRQSARTIKGGINNLRDLSLMQRCLGVHSVFHFSSPVWLKSGSSAESKSSSPLSSLPIFNRFFFDWNTCWTMPVARLHMQTWTYVRPALRLGTIWTLNARLERWSSNSVGSYSSLPENPWIIILLLN